MDTPVTLGVVTTDRGLVIRGWNEWLTAATGHSEAGAVGRPLTDFVSSGRADFYRDLLTDVIESGTPRVLAPAFHHYLIECAPRTPSEHFAHMQQRVTVAPLRNDADVVGVLITLEDVTERLDRERTLSATLKTSASPPPASALTQSLRSDDWRLRRQAVRSLTQVASVDEVRHLLGTLERDHHDLNVLNSALRVLISAGRAVVEPLAMLLASGEPNVRMHAALALGELRAFEALPALIGALEDENENVRFHAIEALGRIGASESVEPLAAVATSGNFFLAFAAIDALSRTDDARVAPLIESLLGDEALRPAAVGTLAAIGDEDSVAALCRVLNGTDDARPIAAALVAIYRRYEELLKAGTVVTSIARDAITDAGLQKLEEAARRPGADRRDAAEVLSWLGPRALDPLIGLVGDADLERMVAAGIGDIGDEAVDRLLPLLLRDQPAIRRAAATLLGQLADRRAIAPLLGALDDVDDTVVAAAVAAVATFGDRAALEPLFALLAHPGTTVRHAAVAAINSVGAPGTATLVGRALNDARAPVRESALRIAGYFGFPEHTAAVREALNDPAEEVRRAAIEQLPVLDDGQAVTRLIDALETETPRNRAAAAHALRLVDDPRIGAPLVRALSDQAAWVRYFAATSIASHPRASGAAAQLSALATRDAATHVRIAAITTLGTLDQTSAIEVTDLLLRDPDDDLAAATVAAVSSIASRDADDLLARAVQSSRPTLQIAAIRAVARRPTLESIELLSWAARVGEPPTLQEAAITSLCGIAGAASQSVVRRAAVEALLELAVDGAYRDAVISAIGTLGEEVVPDVASGLSASRIATRLATVDALAAMRNPRASGELGRALRDEDPAVRGAAVAAFGKLGTPSVARTIAAMRRTDADPNVRQRAAQACDRHGWNAGVVSRA